MFADAFWPNFAFFTLGQVVACLYLATGRLVRGGCLMLAVLLLADVALVARFGYANEPVAVAALMLLQAYAVVEAALYGYGRWYRRRPAVLQRRRAEYRQALIADLRGDDQQAATLLRALCKRDPWDVESTLGLAVAQRRLGNVRGAGALLRRARRLDRAGRATDLIFLETGRLQDERVAARTARSQARATTAVPS